jgi:hypothetical protein
VVEGLRGAGGARGYTDVNDMTDAVGDSASAAEAVYVEQLVLGNDLKSWIVQDW